MSDDNKEPIWQAPAAPSWSNEGTDPSQMTSVPVQIEQPQSGGRVRGRRRGHAPKPAPTEKPKRTGLFGFGGDKKNEKPQQASAPPVTKDPSPVKPNKAVTASRWKMTRKNDRLKLPIKHQRIVVASRSGGVGKTTIVAVLGILLSRHRGQGVVLLEGNPGAGALGFRLRLDLRASAHDILRVVEWVETREDILPYLIQGADNLDVIGDNADPRLPQVDPAEYDRLAYGLSRMYELILIDTPSGLTTSPAVYSLLDSADQVVFCTAADTTSIWQTLRTLSWLEKQGGRARELVDNMVVAVSEVHERTLPEFQEAQHTIISHCPRVVAIPYDPHLAAGGHLNVDQLATPTKQAYWRLAELLSEKFIVKETT